MVITESIDKTIKEQEFWFNHIEQWLANDLSQQEYCFKENVDHRSFVYWRSKFIKSGLGSRLKENKCGFIPVKIKSDLNEFSSFQTGSGIIIFLPNGIKLQVPTGLYQNDLITLIKSLVG